ncbi:MAG: zinc ribbon domain-containing protein [Promethearchaeota archaeon]
MGSKKYDNRYYHKESYETAIGTFGLAIVFIFIGILALIFHAFNIDFIELRSWGYWLFIPAFFISIGAFQQVYTNSKYKKLVKVSLMQRGFQGTYKLEHIALEIGMRPKDLLRVLLDLRNKGIVQYSFNPDTGEIILGQKIVYVPSSEYVPPAKNLDAPIPSGGKNFCVYCGHELDKSATFCPNCGSKL